MRWNDTAAMDSNFIRLLSLPRRIPRGSRSPFGPTSQRPTTESGKTVPRQPLPSIDDPKSGQVVSPQTKRGLIFLDFQMHRMQWHSIGFHRIESLNRLLCFDAIVIGRSTTTQIPVRIRRRSFLMKSKHLERQVLLCISVGHSLTPSDYV